MCKVLYYYPVRDMSRTTIPFALQKVGAKIVIMAAWPYLSLRHSTSAHSPVLTSVYQGRCSFTFFLGERILACKPVYSSNRRYQ
jgi:hypothetical protein